MNPYEFSQLIAGLILWAVIWSVAGYWLGKKL